MNNKILDFYKETSASTYLGLYRPFAESLPDDMAALCSLLIAQVIHPFDLKDEEERNNPQSFYGDMTKVPKTSLIYENDLFPTAVAIVAELLRRDPNFTTARKIENKIHICCREISILMAAILKAKDVPARVRSGFAYFVSEIDAAGDHWIVEYYNEAEKRWVLVDPCMYYDQATLDYFGIDFSLVDVPRNKFIFGAEAYLGLRNGKYRAEDIYYFSTPKTFGMKAALAGLFYDFHALMNDELLFCQTPKYLVDCDYNLNSDEYAELDVLAELMLDPDRNFNELKQIWEQNEKFRIISGGMNS